MTNTFGEKELRTDWDELTDSDDTKGVGHEQSLVAETSYVLERNKVGI